uniref:Uncharacterized protein n=1 Tax=viral metagenome TaxID=1070528 RepID=A0A6M3KZJ2_9ZZZZ
MATVYASLTQHSSLDGTGDTINGSEVDENPNTIAQIIDGTTAVTLGSAGALTFTATYACPLILGTLRLWYDTTNTVLRVKHGSNPSSATDGYMLVEG